MERFEADLVKIAAGDVSNIPQDLLAEEVIMQRIPLSIQASEGVHPQYSIRDTWGSTSLWLTLLCGLVWESLCAPNRSTKGQN